MPDDLYVLQSSAGLIKVGRSKNPEKRRKTLEHSCGLPLRLLFVAHGLGEREDDLHSELRMHRLKGEWFSNCADSRALIRAFLGCAVEFITRPEPRNGKIPKNRRVRHVLSDGTLKVYSYPPHRLTKKYKRAKDQ